MIGRSFDHATIAALTELPEPALGDAMLRLVEAELVFRRGAPPDAIYLFKHALVRDAAYESLLKAKRVAMHARLVDVLERTVNASPEIKAQHAEAGGLTERALGYWEQAGTRALAGPPTGRRSPSWTTPSACAERWRRALAPARAGPSPEARPGVDRQPRLSGGSARSASSRLW